MSASEFTWIYKTRLKNFLTKVWGGYKKIGFAVGEEELLRIFSEGLKIFLDRMIRSGYISRVCFREEEIPLMYPKRNFRIRIYKKSERKMKKVVDSEKRMMYKYDRFSVFGSAKR